MARSRTARTMLAARFDGVRELRAGERFTVFVARRRGSGDEVAVKLPTGHRSVWASDVLAREAATLAAIGPHPAIVRLQEQLTLGDGRPALVFDHHPNSLADLSHSTSPFGGDQLPLRDVLTAGIRVAEALEAVHAAGYVHCDVRPANILMSRAGEAVLAGFEEAVERTADETDAVALHVTTSYTAPELLVGNRPSPATDVYGLAATLYEAVAGHGAFRAYAGESPASIIVRVLNGRVTPIVAPGIPLDISDLLTWALAGNPAARPPTPAWLAEELGRIERRLGLPRTRLLTA